MYIWKVENWCYVLFIWVFCSYWSVVIVLLYIDLYWEVIDMKIYKGCDNVIVGISDIL